MTQAYLAIVIAKGYQERIEEFKKSFPEAKEVSITYYHDGQVKKLDIKMDTFLEELEQLRLINQ